jgi:hypothetical protein
MAELEPVTEISINDDKLRNLISHRKHWAAGTVTYYLEPIIPFVNYKNMLLVSHVLESIILPVSLALFLLVLLFL